MLLRLLATGGALGGEGGLQPGAKLDGTSMADGQAEVLGQREGLRAARAQLRKVEAGEEGQCTA